MKKPAIAGTFSVVAFLSLSHAQAVTADQCVAAISDVKAKMIAAEAVRGAYGHNKSRKGRCIYLSSQMEFVAEARRMFRSCDHIRRPERPPLIENAEKLLERIRSLKMKYCGWQVAEASSIFRIYPVAERNLSH